MPLPSIPILISRTGKAELIPTLELPESSIIVAILELLHLLADLHVPELPTTPWFAQGGPLVAFLPISQLSDGEIMITTTGSITKNCGQMCPVDRDFTLSCSRGKSTQNANALSDTPPHQTDACRYREGDIKLKDFPRNPQ